MQNFVKFGSSIVDILQFLEFLRWRPPPSGIFQNRDILLADGVQRVEIYECAKFRKNRSIGCKDI